MLGTLGIVQVRLGDNPARLKACRTLGGKSLLEWVVRRVTDSQQLDGVVVVVADSPRTPEIAEVVPADVPLFIGQRPDPLGRFAEALDEYPARAVVRIGLENPFVDPALVDRLVTTAKTHPESDYIAYRAHNGRPTILSPLGIFAEWFRAKALRQADEQAKPGADREQVTRYIYSHPELFNLRLLPVPPGLDRDDVRLRLDSEEDWEHARAIFDALGPDRLEWQNIADLLDQQPQLRERMAELNQARA